ncbi:CCR4-NOT transcription complex subunit 1, TTP binding domain [Cinara cedri]|uniref:CCR4-NOT transcription complex subunit 1, TTP binding domain n=1 Tax=Cinara cedri TaxID=506608 RepID=A0A5E4LZE4_9HEMI|nr:CCR4-NOT transcription complex subunit 1, TTP binding domain [Cinara cedri]
MAERIAKVRFRRLYYSAMIQQTQSVDYVLHSLEDIYYRPKRKEIIWQVYSGNTSIFPTYKRNELIFVGHLCGGVIERGIIENDENSRIALQFVLEALKQDHKSDSIQTKQIEYVLRQRTVQDVVEKFRPLVRYDYDCEKNRITMIDEFGELDSFSTRSYNSGDRGEFRTPFVVKVLESCADSKGF